MIKALAYQKYRKLPGCCTAESGQMCFSVAVLLTRHNLLSPIHMQNWLLIP
jgi:hypothetical protein